MQEYGVVRQVWEPRVRGGRALEPSHHHPRDAGRQLELGHDLIEILVAQVTHVTHQLLNIPEARRAQATNPMSLWWIQGGEITQLWRRTCGLTCLAVSDGHEAAARVA